LLDMADHNFKFTGFYPPKIRIMSDSPLFDNIRRIALTANPARKSFAAFFS
jgi:hypothetical protein